MGNLNLPTIAPNQDDKETTSNAADAILDGAISDIYTADLTSGNDTVSDANFRNHVLFLGANATTAGRTVTLPGDSIIRGFIVLAASASNTASIDFVVGSSTVTLQPGQVRFAFTDATANGLFEQSVEEQVGWMPYAYVLGASPVDVPTTAGALTASGGSIALPVAVHSKMALDGVAIWNNDTASLRTAEWRLYKDVNANSLLEVPGANGTFSFTPSAASMQVSQVGSPPVVIEPGVYWLVIRNTHASNTFDVGRQTATTLMMNTAQTKVLGSGLGATLDFVAATWTKQTDVFAARLEGRVFGDTTKF